MLRTAPIGLAATLAAPRAPIANTETQVIGVTIPAGSLVAGNTYRITAVGLLTNTTVSTSAIFRIRYGTTTLLGNIPAASTLATGTTARANIPFMVTALITVSAVGAVGVVFGGLFIELANAVAPVISAAITVAVALDTTADKILELTFISGGATTTATFISAIIEALG